MPLGPARRDEHDYEPLDPTLACYDHRVATMSLDGEVRGYLACVVGAHRTLTSAAMRPWPWFRVVWADGRREPPEEDYGPGWDLVRELDAGHLDYQDGPSQVRHGWLWDTWVRPHSTTRYAIDWLDPEESAAVWERLGLTDDDF